MYYYKKHGPLQIKLEAGQTVENALRRFRKKVAFERVFLTLKFRKLFVTTKQRRREKRKIAARAAKRNGGF